MTTHRSGPAALRSVRARLLVSAALGLAAAATPAHAEGSDAPSVAFAPEREAYSSGGQFLEVVKPEAQTTAYLPATAPEAQSLISPVAPEPQSVQLPAVSPEPEIVIADPNTPTTARDTGVTGVGQMVVDSGGGFIGLCTATLINPRTVIFAAHCVNSNPATAYGANSGGTGIAFGFEAYTRANAPGETDELVRWLLGSGANQAGRFQTNLAQSFFNSNWVNYNAASLEPEARGFLYGDVAVASLDTPAEDVPTWAMLFSPLTAPASIGASGTGYNVGLIGYGRNGTGITGAGTTIDYRRRTAENILGALTDLETFESFLFGGAPNGLKQNLYFLDFDDPRRGTASATAFDFNAFRDNARAGTNGGSSREGLTSQGDSGGPLVLQTANAQTIIGVLSGGYTRFFSGQPANGYGTVSFYQPLYLYWDWIAANNPYHYVTNVAGDRKWSDPTNWVTTLDPAYKILSPTGTIVNGVPTAVGEGKNGTSGDFGQICFQSGGISDCYDTKTGVETVTVAPIGTEDGAPLDGSGSLIAGGRSNGMGTDVISGAQASDGSASAQIVAQASDGSQSPAATQQALPAATLANGLPGATNFVPNNVDPVRTTGTIGKYFDVTLSAAGTTTLDTTATVDRFKLTGAQTTLNITSAGSLTSLMDIMQTAGTMRVDGTLTTPGDYFLLSGGITGNGTIKTPFFTSAGGAISPGTSGTVGTLNFQGNVILASGNALLVDLGDNGVSDKVAVTATTFNGTTPTNGMANVGGIVGFSPVAGQTVRAGNVYTILTAQGGVTGTFAAPNAISAILTPKLVYSATQVQARIDAGSYFGVVDTGSPVQSAYAYLLDQNRAANQGRYSDIYGPLDLSNAATIRATLQALAPRTETTKTMMGIALVEGMSQFYRDHMATLSGGEQGGTVAMIGKPQQFAALAAGTLPGQEEVASDYSDNVTTEDSGMSDDVGLYFAGGYIDAESDAMTASTGPAEDDFNGFFAATGVDIGMGDDGVLGFGLSYSRLRGAAGASQYVKSSLIQGTIYAKQYFGQVVVDAQLGAGVFEARTRRSVALPAATYTLRSRDRAFSLNSETGVGYEADFGSVAVTPRVSFRASRIEFSPTDETGGGPALHYDRQTYSSAQGRAGLTLKGKDATTKPFIAAHYVHEFNDRAGGYIANFVGSQTQGALFLTNSQDKDWAEASVGLQVDLGDVALSASAEISFFRDDLKDRTYRGSLTFKF